MQEVIRRACPTGEGGNVNEALAGHLVFWLRATEAWDLAKTVLSSSVKPGRQHSCDFRTSLQQALLRAFYLNIVAAAEVSHTSSNCRKINLNPKVRRNHVTD